MAINPILPLTIVSPGQKVKLVAISAGKKLRLRLTELGLTPGVELCVMQDQGGPILVSVYNSRLALGRGMAHQIMVEQVNGCPQ
jgi:ferrous iron transport protein A